jgi:hypothetical protein
MSSAMAPQGEKYQRLHDFLMGSFLPADFQMFLMFQGGEFAGVARAANINVGEAQYFFDVVQRLGRGGLIHGEFFDRLAKELPAKAAGIESLRERWLVEDQPDPKPPGGPTPSDLREPGLAESATPGHQSPITPPIGLRGYSDSNIKVAEDTFSVELLINKPFDEYTEKDQFRLFEVIKKILEIDGDIRVSKRRGSLWLRIDDLTPAQAERLSWAVRAGELDQYNVKDIKILTPIVFPRSHEKAPSRPDPANLSDTLRALTVRAHRALRVSKDSGDTGNRYSDSQRELAQLRAQIVQLEQQIVQLERHVHAQTLPSLASYLAALRRRVEEHLAGAE